MAVTVAMTVVDRSRRGMGERIWTERQSSPLTLPLVLLPLVMGSSPRVPDACRKLADFVSTVNLGDDTGTAAAAVASGGVAAGGVAGIVGLSAVTMFVAGGISLDGDLSEVE